MSNSKEINTNGGQPDTQTSPPFSPTSTVSSADSQTTIDSLGSNWATPPSTQRSFVSKYTIASHSVRITKCGYTLEPIELRYPEIIKNMSKSSARQSNLSFSSNQVGNKFLCLIRGFWSQPGFPKGQLAKPSPNNTFDTLLEEFSKFPLYPHKRTYIKIPESSKGSKQKSKRVKTSSSSRKKPAISSSKTIKAISLPPIDDLGRTVKSRYLSFGKPTVPPVLPEEAYQKPPLSPSVRTKSITDHKTDDLTDFSSAYYANSQSLSKSGSSSKSKSTSDILYKSWIPNDKEQIIELITALCLNMEEIFSNEPRIIKISSPCIVLGDIHGNLTDLRTYERSLWPKAPVCITSNYLFLGDYVDRGDFSIECILYLFSMKLISPKKFLLLRGNHEVAAIQRQYTFGKECEFKFGSLGKDLWRSFNRVFDLMPIAAIIDDQIFCAHGGIPKSITDLKILSESIPSPLENPEIQCPAAWEILWNDPITDGELVSMIELDNIAPTHSQIAQPVQPPAQNGATSDLVPAENQNTENQNSLTVPSDTSSIASTTPQQIINDGFIANIKRGTAYLFSDKAIDHFLQVNKLSHIIRAHEVIPTGFAFHGDGRVITIFSSSKYCGLNNQAACILIDQERIRILRLDTGEEGE